MPIIGGEPDIDLYDRPPCCVAFKRGRSASQGIMWLIAGVMRLNASAPALLVFPNVAGSLAEACATGASGRDWGGYGAAVTPDDAVGVRVSA